MARPPRIEIPGAVYLLSSRCDPGVAACVDDADRRALLALVAQTMQRFDAQVLAYCLQPDHFQLLLFTRQANLSRLMRHLNGVYTQYHNRRHGSEGPLFHGRFKAVLVDREAHLLDACRYVELSPLRLGLVRDLAAWSWSSYRAHVGLEPAPPWLDADGLHAFVLGRSLRGALDRRRAADRYADLVASEPDLDLWAGRLRQQIFLGDAAFVKRMKAAARAAAAALAAASKAVGVPGQAARARPGPGTATVGPARTAWEECLAANPSREQALYSAHTEGGWSMTALAAELGLSVSRVSRLIAGVERGRMPG
ncbi:transposase [Paucibacter sp. DJ2R-2]|uniref:transposase n=1 Tax=Paucibacter sp. DJ2R-2 TaxID=2893558 RepID=UPI0021E40F2F|nr:transposase [Paucibacter sp. DJ2R-2]MCV2420073.1 transposase [Paucibacter sp. DJ4R-1]MCV2437000.1 transposase [Paucibacter sp. DJ2R-2]